MQTLLDKLFIQSFEYFNNKGLSIPQSLKVVDLLLLDLDVDCNNTEEYTSYLNNFIDLNKLLYKYINLTEEELKLFDNNNMQLLSNLAETKRTKNITNFKDKRKAIYDKYEPELIELVNQLKPPLQLAA